jgi:hypothetical protein
MDSPSIEFFKWNDLSTKDFGGVCGGSHQLFVISKVDFKYWSSGQITTKWVGEHFLRLNFYLNNWS